MKSDWNFQQFGFKFTTYSNPYDPEDPWPCMRGNITNNGRISKDIKITKNKGDLYHFHTSNSIFSTPIIDKHEQIFVGSADHRFYALDPHQKKEIWQKSCTEIIDSAACIDKEGKIYVAAGDGQIHAYDTNGSEMWTFNVGQNRQKSQFTFSSLYWYEANIVKGPDGALYAANDDFFLYKMTPKGEIIWAFRTGFLIWSAAAFGSDGTVYIAGFDYRLYAIDSISGFKKWDINLNGSLVASPVVGDDTIFQGSFNGNMYAIDTKTQKIKWTYSTGSHIYATPALSCDNILYFGSSNGVFYALDASTGNLKWTFYIGDAIRSSASIGPDIEEKAPYLIYLGGGDGIIYALDPSGQLRWGYNTLIKVLNKDYPNINASIALGFSGLATASSTGDVVWIPYDYYLRPSAEGILHSNPFKIQDKPIQCYFITAGGKINPTPITSVQSISPVSTISIRSLFQSEKAIIPVSIDPKSISVQSNPAFEFTTLLQSDRCTINIIPEHLLSQDTVYNLKIAFKCSTEGNQSQSFTDILSFQTMKNPATSNFLTSVMQSYKIVQMALPQPPIIPSLNQIGFASLTIPFRILAIDNETHRFIAWGAHKFGGDGSPLNRVSFYAFSGTFQSDWFMMDAHNCLFEITAFSIPLNRFRVAGEIMTNDIQGLYNNIVVEKHIGTKISQVLKEVGSSSPINSQILRQYIKIAGLGRFLKTAFQFFPNLMHQINPAIWRTWGLLNANWDLAGVGRSKILPLSTSIEGKTQEIEVESFIYNDSKYHIRVLFHWKDETHRNERAIGILIWNKTTMDVLPLNYNLVVKCSNQGQKTIIICTIPKKKQLSLRGYSASLMVDLELIDSIALQ